MDVSIIIVNFNTGEYLAGCLDSLLAQTLDGLEIEYLVVDSLSTTDQTAYLEEAREKLAYFSRHPKARKRMAERAREKILSGHTYLHRVRAMVANMEDLFCRTKATDVPAPEAVREVLPLRRHSPL